MSNVDLSSATKQVDFIIKNNPKDANNDIQSKSESLLKADISTASTLKDKVTFATKSEKENAKDFTKQEKSKKFQEPVNLDLTRFSLRFETDRELDMIITKIIDKKTGAVVAQIPPEQTIKTIKYFEKNPGQLVSAQA